MNTLSSSWICPTCQLPITLNNKVWCCENKHSFDLAKEGYVNLLLAHQKNSKEPGDNKAMVNARRAFLEQGHYQALAQTVGQIFINHIAALQNNYGIQDSDNIAFFDAGCGEGYYLNTVSQMAQSNQIDCVYSGIDISKNAVLKAAKKYPGNSFAVASTYHLPVQSSSQNAVLQIFAPSSEQEVHRVLKAQGIWITVNPAANHLHQLKKALYDKPEQHKESQTSPDGFALTLKQNLSFDLTLNTKADREHLLMMTPYYWTATEEKKQALIETLQTVTTDFDIRIYQRVN